MGLNGVIRYVQGNVTFEARNGFCERLINLCASNNIGLWDFKKTEEGFIARCTAKDYKTVKRMSKKVNVEVRIQKKRGLLFKAGKYRKRWGIFAGAAIFLVFIFLSQCFVWDIEVTGNQTVPESVVLSELSQVGIHKMCFIPSLDLRLKKQQALLKLPQLSWMAINQSGCKLTVNVTERQMPPQIEEETPCDIVAARDGQIRYMEVYDGDTKIGVDYTVNKGDVIVSGAYTTKKGDTIYVHADAKVIAEVQFEKTISIDLAQMEKEYTGKTKTRYFLNLFSFRIPLFVAFPIKGDYDVSSQSTPVTLFSKELPVGIDSYHYRFYNKKSAQMTKEEARAVLKDCFLQYETTDLKGTAILSREVTETEKDGIITMKTAYIAEQNIAQEREIDLSSIPPQEGSSEKPES